LLTGNQLAIQLVSFFFESLRRIHKVPASVDSHTRASRCRSRPPLSLGMMPQLWACSLTMANQGANRVARSR
jgi:hypothetical protein